MKVGWNSRYVLHRLSCEEWVSKPSKLLILTVLISCLVLGFSSPGVLVFPEPGPAPVVQQASFQLPILPKIDPAVSSMVSFLKKYAVDEEHRDRVAVAIVKSARKYDLDPRLAAAIMIVESRANPFAISNFDSIGIMQIHLPTWGATAEKQGINLFKVEDNVDFGVRILKDYVRRFGMWEGVKRYKGWLPDDPDSSQAADDYVAKVQHIYGTDQSAPLSAGLVQ
jgi:soluble lytic murein transglycosylase-like protein